MQGCRAHFTMTTPTQLVSWIGKLPAARILVIGDVMLDRYVFGTVSRISPEAPIPVLHTSRTYSTLGGAGNVARNLDALGARTHLIGVVGNDPAATEIGAILAGLGSTTTSLVAEAGRTTVTKTRFLTGQQQMLRVDAETASGEDPETLQKIRSHVSEHIRSCDAVLLSDYGKGTLGGDLPRWIIGLARESRKPVVVDPKGDDFDRYSGASVITPNAQELRHASRLPVEGDAAIVAASRRIIDECGIQALLATRSEKGMTLVEASGAVLHSRAEAREVYDVSGAGDTVIAVFAAALGAGASMPEAAALANAAAGIVVGKQGTSVVSPSELGGALASRELSGALRKVVDLPAAVRQVASWREHGLRTGFTNGIFDLLHTGHLSLLRQAAARCDRLVVGLNGDRSVRALRGDAPSRNEAARSAILGSLEMVDMIVVFQDETPLGVIEALKPEVLIKGGNYRDDEVVGGELVRGYGGEVFRAEIFGDTSARSDSVTQGTF